MQEIPKNNSIERQMASQMAEKLAGSAKARADNTRPNASPFPPEAGYGLSTKVSTSVLHQALAATQTNYNNEHGDPVAINNAFSAMLAVLIENKAVRCSNTEFGSLVLAQFRLLQATMSTVYNRELIIEAISFLAMAAENAE